MISIVIPVYGMDNAVEFLKRNLDSIKMQTYKDYEIVITDNSADDLLLIASKPYEVRYFKSKEYGMARNTNQAINKADGDLIKILYQDDYFAHENALQHIVDYFDRGWLIAGSDNNPHPYYSEYNTLGSPSALTIRKDCPLRFDPEFYWVLDLDFYRRLHKLYGPPLILDGVNVNIGLGQHQTTHKLTNERKQIEEKLLRQKYDSSL